MNNREIQRLTQLAVAGNQNAQRQLSNALRKAVKNLEKARREANELAVAAVLSAGLPPLSRAQTIARNNGARGLMKIKKPW